MPDIERNIVATWSDMKQVCIWDVSSQLASLDGNGSTKLREEPVFKFSGHGDEGFALDWSRISMGRLLVGDCSGQISLWNPLGPSWNVEKERFSHAKSVEDLQWSPTENDVFASCSVDQTIRLWDARNRGAAVAQIHAHECDVNVISWNRLASNLLLSGADNGSFKVWDLRIMKSGQPAAHFQWHKDQITSVTWHPTDESVLAVAGADDQITMWDLSLERDAESDAQEEPEVPPQLLFIHQGQKEVKEVHWHPQIPGLMMSTALSGVNIFRTISV